MANIEDVDLKLVIKHLSNGTIGENLCIVCLAQLDDKYENIHTKVCKEEKDSEFCVAYVLESFLSLKFSDNDNYNVCTNCFMAAFTAYKFVLLSSRSKQILNYYLDELTQSLNYIHSPDDLHNKTLCISLPLLEVIQNFNLNLEGIGKNSSDQNVKCKLESEMSIKMEDDDNIMFMVQENEEQLFYKVSADGKLELLDENEKNVYKKTLSLPLEFQNAETPKERRKRLPMTHKLCSRCPVKYRFAAKLKEHMKQEHNIDLFICKVCKVITEDELEYHNHMRTHTNIHQCAICQTVFKKRDTIINHLKWHEKMKNIGQTDGAHICEICGVITEDERRLRDHYDCKHCKKYTCYYCGRLYKGEISFEMHIKKHEAHLQDTAHKSKTKGVIKQVKTEPVRKEDSNKQKCMCPTCGRYFVDERALMWHQRLHSNERPYKCEVCGRSFVSLNRRNQHALCAHTAPTRRCPLCPALFHLKSMVNTHIRKVHLKDHKRRNRVSKHQNVYWRTEPVPIQDLSIDIQNQILELQADKKENQIPKPDYTLMNTEY